MTRTETIKLPVSCGYVPLSLDPFDDAEEWRIVDADGVVVAWDDVIAALNATATAPTTAAKAVVAMIAKTPVGESRARC